MSQVGIGTLLFCVLFGAIIWWLITLQRLSERLRTHHPAVYESLGRPNSMTRNTSATRTAVIRFLASGQHRTLNDEHVRRLGNSARYTLSFIVVFGLALIVMAVIWPPAT